MRSSGSRHRAEWRHRWNRFRLRHSGSRRRAERRCRRNRLRAAGRSGTKRRVWLRPPRLCCACRCGLQPNARSPGFSGLRFCSLSRCGAAARHQHRELLLQPANLRPHHGHQRFHSDPRSPRHAHPGPNRCRQRLDSGPRRAHSALQQAPPGHQARKLRSAHIGRGRRSLRRNQRSQTGCCATQPKNVLAAKSREARRARLHWRSRHNCGRGHHHRSRSQ